LEAAEKAYQAVVEERAAMAEAALQALKQASKVHALHPVEEAREDEVALGAAISADIALGHGDETDLAS
jgi:hypothetical protein